VCPLLDADGATPRRRRGQISIFEVNGELGLRLIGARKIEI
jgi:hypothetical protein